MRFQTTTQTRPSLQGQLKLARLLEMSECDFEKQIHKLESNELFPRLLATGVLTLQPTPEARFIARRFAGRELRTSSDGLPGLLDGQGDLAKLLERIGQERFEECFLQDTTLSDEQRASLCGIAPGEVLQLRKFVDQLYIQAEFENSASNPVPTKVFSAVAGIHIEKGQPVLGFFHRDIWKSRYNINAYKREELLNTLPHRQARRMEYFLKQLEYLDRRKSTLYRILETLVGVQADFFITRDPSRRQPLTQRTLASRLNIAPSVLNRLISNKSFQLPWGLEAPLKVLVPSAKSLLRDLVYRLAIEHTDFSDEDLRQEVHRCHGKRLSRRSIAQYRKELGLAGQGQRNPRLNQSSYTHGGSFPTTPLMCLSSEKASGSCPVAR